MNVEILEHINLAQFGVAAPFIAYLIWQNVRLATAVEKWQDKYTSLLENQSKDYIGAAQTFEKVLTALRIGS